MAGGESRPRFAGLDMELVVRVVAAFRGRNRSRVPGLTPGIDREPSRAAALMGAGRAISAATSPRSSRPRLAGANQAAALPAPAAGAGTAEPGGERAISPLRWEA